MRSFFAAVLFAALPVACHAAVTGPCDIYAAGGSPCVAAHSMTRALYSTYHGPLYNLKRSSDGATKDVGTLTAGGIADAATQVQFCGASACVVQRIYDQSDMGNHLGIEHGAPNLSRPRNQIDLGVNFTNPLSKAKVGGRDVFAAYFAGPPSGGDIPRDFLGQGYSNRTARGTAVGDAPQCQYAIFSGRHFSHGCCFDYGNAENITAKGQAGPMFKGTMEAVYFGAGYAPNGPGSGKGPWVGADMEVGIYESDNPHKTTPSLPASDFVAGFVKGKPGNHFNVKAATLPPYGTGALTTVWDGPRPSGYEVMKKQGGIILGIGGDNSPWGAGVFYEGVMTNSFCSDETEADVMENIVAANYTL